MANITINKCSKCSREKCLDKLGYDDNRCALETCGVDHNFSVDFNLCIQCIRELQEKDPDTVESLYNLLKEWEDHILEKEHFK